MDFVKWKIRISERLSKYKYVGIILVIGLILMMIPGKDNSTANEAQQVPSVREDTLAEQLEKTLCCVAGAGQVKVMLAVAQGERTIYQTDSTYSQSEQHTDTRTETILITDGQRNETGLVHQKNPPTYQGAIVLAQGADDPVVKLTLVEAVADVTGLGADKISVLKMQ